MSAKAATRRLYSLEAAFASIDASAASAALALPPTDLRICAYNARSSGFTLAGTPDVLLVTAGVSRAATVAAVLAPPDAAAGPPPPE
jgi:hypothetical protein